MLASILPGLRDLRTPLATGYLWLAALWLLVADRVPATIADTSGPVAEVYRLGGLVGSAGVLAALSFIAYLVGSILQLTNDGWVARYRVAAYRSVLRLAGRENPRSVGTFLSPMAIASKSVLVRAAQQQLDRLDAAGIDDQGIRGVLDGGGLAGDVGAGAPRAVLARAISEQLPAVAIQLQVKHRDMWDSYDRHQSESQFRYAVAPPLALLVIVYAWQAHHAGWLLLLLVPFVLLLLGDRERNTAEAVLVEAVNLRIAAAPIQEELDELAVTASDGSARRRPS